MAPENFQSPNAIPPRRSSNGLSLSLPGLPSLPMGVLKPVPEADWIAPSPGKRRPNTSSSSSPLSPEPPLANGDSNCAQGKQRSWSQEKEKILLGPYDYMFNHPGKDIRKQLIAAFNAWLRVPDESLAIITKVIGMLHTASLL